MLGIFIPLNALRAVLSNQFPLLKSPLIELLGLRGVMILGVCLAIAVLITSCVLSLTGGAVIIATLAALSPFCAVTFGQAAWKAAHYDATAFGTSRRPRIWPASAKGPRVSVGDRRRMGLPLTFRGSQP